MLTQLSQRYEYAMLTNSVCSIAITFFLVVNFWKVEGYHPKRKFSLTIKVCLFLFVSLVGVRFFFPVETIMKDRRTLKGAMSPNMHARANEDKLEKDGPTFSSCVGDFGRLFLSV